MAYKFEDGDTVIVHKPNNIHELPTWLSGMDKYDGREFVVAGYNSGGYVRIKGNLGYVFSENWLELVNSDVDINLDITDVALTDFLSEWR